MNTMWANCIFCKAKLKRSSTESSELLKTLRWCERLINSIMSSIVHYFHFIAFYLGPYTKKKQCDKLYIILNYWQTLPSNNQLFKLSNHETAFKHPITSLLSSVQSQHITYTVYQSHFCIPAPCGQAGIELHTTLSQIINQVKIKILHSSIDLTFSSLHTPAILKSTRTQQKPNRH